MVAAFLATAEGISQIRNMPLEVALCQLGTGLSGRENCSP